MLNIAKETAIIFNDEYIKYQPLISTIEARLEKDIELLQYNRDDRQDALDYAHDKGKPVRLLENNRTDIIC